MEDMRNLGRYWCPQCVVHQFPNCTRCEMQHYAGDMRTLHNPPGSHPDMPRRRMCRNCRDAVQGHEFHGETRNFQPTSSFGSSRYFGLELETNMGKASSDYAFGAKHDGSISGWEFVSHKLRGDAGLEETQRFMETGEFIEIGDNCGFHMHIDLSDLTSDQCRAVFGAFVVTEDFWFSKVRDNRRHNNYCYKLGENIFNDIRASYDYSEFAGYQDRNAWINAASYRRHATLENRLYHATWDYSEVRDWVVLNLRFVEAVRRLRLAGNDSWESYKDKVVPCLDWAQSQEPIESLYPPVTVDANMMLGA